MTNTMTNTMTPRAGHNQPDLAPDIAQRLADEYAALETGTARLLEEARLMPRDVTDDNLPQFVSIIKRIRDHNKSLEATHDAEKAPHLRAGQVIDGWFFTFMDKLTRRNPKAKPGAGDILQARVNDYTDRKIAEEQEARRLAAANAETERLERECVLREAEARAEEDRLTAERARAPAQIERKTEIAETSEAEANAARVEAFVATNRAEQAQMMTLARPADVVRTRVEEGMLTAARKDEAVVTDYALLDMNALRPYINHDTLDKAVRAWAKTTGYTQAMPGVQITNRHKGWIV